MPFRVVAVMADWNWAGGRGKFPSARDARIVPGFQISPAWLLRRIARSRRARRAACHRGGVSAIPSGIEDACYRQTEESAMAAWKTKSTKTTLSPERRSSAADRPRLEKMTPSVAREFSVLRHSQTSALAIEVTANRNLSAALSTFLTLARF